MFFFIFKTSAHFCALSLEWNRQWIFIATECMCARKSMHRKKNLNHFRFFPVFISSPLFHAGSAAQQNWVGRRGRMYSIRIHNEKIINNFRWHKSLLQCECSLTRIGGACLSFNLWVNGWLHLIISVNKIHDELCAKCNEWCEIENNSAFHISFNCYCVLLPLVLTRNLLTSK